MINRTKRNLFFGSLLPVIALAGCVSQSKYDALQAQNQQLQTQNSSLEQQLAAQKQQVGRLQGAIKYTVNSDLLFAPGSWQMKEQGKVIIARMAAKLAPTQQNKLLVNGYTDNTPIGPALQQEGVTSNQILSERRAQAVMEYIISQGVKPDLIEAHGFGESNPVASNDTAKGRAANRRVELELASG
jgi:chemotaxis protein MotB